MPNKSPEELTRLVTAAFEKLGASAEDSAIVAQVMIDANSTTGDRLR